MRQIKISFFQLSVFVSCTFFFRALGFSGIFTMLLVMVTLQTYATTGAQRRLTFCGYRSMAIRMLGGLQRVNAVRQMQACITSACTDRDPFVRKAAVMAVTRIYKACRDDAGNSIYPHPSSCFKIADKQINFSIAHLHRCYVQSKAAPDSSNSPRALTNHFTHFPMQTRVQ